MSTETIHGKVAELMQDPSQINEGVTTAVVAVPGDCPTGFDKVEVAIELEQFGLEPIQVSKSFNIQCKSKQEDSGVCQGCLLGRDGGFGFKVNAYNIGPSEDHQAHS